MAAREDSSSSTNSAASELATDVAEFIQVIFDAIDYEAVLFADADDEDEDDGLDDGSDDFIYGETSIPFFLSTLDVALSHAGKSSRNRGFLDLGGGKGQLALAAAFAQPQTLSGRCVSLELLPELHRIGQSAAAVAATKAADSFSRIEAQRGSIYSAGDLERCGVRDAAVVFAYATKFQSSDGVHVERLSAALAASSLSTDAVVVTVNRRLCSSDGWRTVAPPIEDDAPEHESSAVAHFWMRARDG